jgi:hypothetical protein
MLSNSRNITPEKSYKKSSMLGRTAGLGHHSGRSSGLLFELPDLNIYSKPLNELEWRKEMTESKPENDYVADQSGYLGSNKEGRERMEK